MKAVIPAAGLGTRFLPGTKAVPKEMLTVLDKPVIQHVVEEALAAKDCDACVIVTSDAKPAMKAQFQPAPNLELELEHRGKQGYAEAVRAASELNVQFVTQHEALGLGHALWCASSKTQDAPFYVLLGDVVVPNQDILPRLLEVSRAHGGASVMAVVRVRDEEVSRFGIVAPKLDDAGMYKRYPQSYNGQELEVYKVEGLVEKPAQEDAPSNLAIFGRYLLTPKVHELLAQTKPGAGDEIQLTDALVELLKYEDIYVVVIDADDGYDTGTIPNLIAANLRMALKDHRYAGDITALLADVMIDSETNKQEE